VRFSFAPALFLCLGFGAGCQRKVPARQETPAQSAKPPQGLTPEQAAQVLARVGEKVITLGDYAAALARMDRFERLRYQSPDRRKQLLDELIAVELLADEARRRGLDREPETQMRLDQALRDEVLRQHAESQPGPDAIPAQDVRAYFDEHKQEFDEPERRRISELVVGSAAAAQKILEQAKNASSTQWGELVRAHSIERRGAAEALPLELEGDLGVVSAPGKGGANEPRLADEVLKAAFRIDKVGSVWPEPVLVQGRYHVVRLTSRTPARQRTFSEAERSIRVTLAQKRIEASRDQLLDELRKKLPVVVNQQLLATVKSGNK
jgi:parvulin-like peptidyl-prolyl isomerase